MPLTIVYAGTPEFAVPALEAIIAAGHRVAAVYTQPDRPAGRGRALTPSPVKQAALRSGLPVLQPATLKDPAEVVTLAAFAPDVMVVAAYGLLLPPAILAVPRLGCVNIHASLLPRWRGAAPVQRALLAADLATGTSIMRMEAGLDTGPVYADIQRPIGPRDTAATLTAALAAQGAALLLQVLAALEAGTAVAVPQPAAGVTYAHKLEKREARLDWAEDAVVLGRRVRAFQPWPVAETVWRGAPLRVHEAEPLAETVGTIPGTIIAAGAAGVDVATGGGVLRLIRVQQAGRNVVAAAEFARNESRHGPLIGQVFGGIS
ncbi:MAG: methionyl-tRNA formyltransferase [Pseudomonadota bacterium]